MFPRYLRLSYRRGFWDVMKAGGTSIPSFPHSYTQKPRTKARVTARDKMDQMYSRQFHDTIKTGKMTTLCQHFYSLPTMFPRRQIVYAIYKTLTQSKSESCHIN